MALRDLVMGGAGCSGGAGPSSNPMAGLADALIGGKGKAQERLQELPGLVGPGEHGPLGGFERPPPGVSLPGGPGEAFGAPGSSQAAEFMRGFSERDRFLDEAWTDSTQGPPLMQQPFQDRGEAAHFEEFERLYGQNGSMPGEAFADGAVAPQRVLSGFLHSFFDSSRGDMPFLPARLPDLALSQVDKQRIRDRSSIMARHLFAERGEAFVDAQVGALLQSLNIDGNLEDERRIAGPMGGRFSEFEDYWNQSGAGGPGKMAPGDQWAAEFHQNGPSAGWAEEFSRDGGAWANEFQQEHGNQWAEEAAAQARHRVTGQDQAALQQTRNLVDTLSQNQDPKFQNSKFLQFVSKMSRGELIMEDNKVRPATGNDWATQFDEGRHEREVNGWPDEFQQQAGPGPQSQWADEFERLQLGERGGWVDEFSQQAGTRDWADEFGEQVAKGTFEEGESEWLNGYNQFVEEAIKGEGASSSRWSYEFADQNPYVGHPQPLKEGQDLFRRGLLSEAVLALEAEVLKHPDSVDGWRLLGMCNAENDDDRQAIAAMARAREAEPTNLEVLLSLGVSHTNELEQAEALGYLQSWLANHPRYSKLVPGGAEGAASLSHPDVVNLFRDAAREAPEDPDVHTVLGVLFNLSREYDLAIRAFQTALELKPQDYSLWNKLGATQANSARSTDAVGAYQQALDLKPNYVRAWSNMGIGYANQGRYEESVRYYVRALQMNPKATNAWGYLRISLSCAGRMDLVEAADRHDLDLLAKEFPL